MTLRFPLPQRLLARIEHDHTELVKALPVLAELSSWAANYTPDNDGYPAGGNSGPRSSDTTSTTERAALAGCSEAEMDRIVEGFLAGTTQLLLAASRLRAYVTPREVKRGRQVTVDVCPGCDQPTDKVKSGFCPACYQQWAIREQRPDRAWFIRRRKVEREEAAQREAEARRAQKAG